MWQFLPPQQVMSCLTNIITYLAFSELEKMPLFCQPLAVNKCPPRPCSYLRLLCTYFSKENIANEEMRMRKENTAWAWMCRRMGHYCTHWLQALQFWRSARLLVTRWHCQGMENIELLVLSPLLTRTRKRKRLCFSMTKKRTKWERRENGFTRRRDRREE